MGAYLSQPNTAKTSSDGGNGNMSYGFSAMQGWRVSMEVSRKMNGRMKDKHVDRFVFSNAFEWKCVLSSKWQDKGICGFSPDLFVWSWLASFQSTLKVRHTPRVAFPWASPVVMDESHDLSSGGFGISHNIHNEISVCS